MAKPSDNPPVEDITNRDWGFEYIYQQYLTRVDGWSATQFKKNVVIAVLVSLALMIAAVLLPINSILQAVVAIPASIIIFGLGVAVAHRRRDSNAPSFKEKYSASQRWKIAIIPLAIFIAAVALLSSRIPYAIGGVFFVVGILFFYNLLRRTPTEMAFTQAGVADPRDWTEEEEAEMEEYIEQIEEQDFETMLAERERRFQQEENEWSDADFNAEEDGTGRYN